MNAQHQKKPNPNPLTPTSHPMCPTTADTTVGREIEEHLSLVAHIAAICLQNSELLHHYNRLRGTNIQITPLPKSPLEAMIDKACQLPPVIWTEQERSDFYIFVQECILNRLSPLTP